MPRRDVPEPAIPAADPPADGRSILFVAGLEPDSADPYRAIAACLARRGWPVATLDAATAASPNASSLADIGILFEASRTDTASPIREEGRGEQYLTALDAQVDRQGPEIIVVRGGDALARRVRARARARGAVVVASAGEGIEDGLAGDADAWVVASRFAAEYQRRAHGLDCVVLPDLIDPGPAPSGPPESTYLTFVDPTAPAGVWAFARVADELGRRRPDIPILVVEGRGVEADVAACGLDLRTHGNVAFMSPVEDPRCYWRHTKVLLLPSPRWDAPGRRAAEAMANGIPVVASDRGSLPETLGGAGFALPLPDRLTPATRWLPTAEEVAPWVEAVVRLWDDRDFYEEQRLRASAEARRRATEVLEPRYVEFFDGVRPRSNAPAAIPSARAAAAVLVPHLNGIVWECEQSLRALEEAGLRVIRWQGSSQIDVARNQLASDALHDGFESIFFIDADLGFDPTDALRLVARPEPVVSGVYAKKGRREVASLFADGLCEIMFGAGALGLYPLKYAATGFLRIRATALRRLIDGLDLPLCNTKWGRGVWPFFQPIWVPDGEGGQHYLGEDWAFSYRLSQVGVTPLADTSIRLWHYGQYAYGWEDAGENRPRHRSYRYYASSPGKRPSPA